MIGTNQEAKRLRMTKIRIANCKSNNFLVSNKEILEKNLPSLSLGLFYGRFTN